MKFASASALVLSLPLLAAASAIRRTDGTGPSNQCNTGSLQCCNSAQSASSLSGTLLGLLGLLGVVVGDLTGEVGVTCSPITVIGAGGSSCTAQPVCCTNNNFNGVVALGCTPINLNL
ncbi:fungal hydrophobin-domain-containing protein [Crepidotus variabilis]|uniref:Hydrophobin n=1 Tax=Crepidotus variabilis TaxID=179855 RepID=A0A9P6EFE6_9AGAR|nr:fungal hydrophobin-domain-containing protein [Crepidotus variabilis]